ncbi:MAG TPA: transglycosylase domain-containing protein, partial [Actinomycetota bacterium]|nr:transglycosylase domain-containing protein [Actinomycetota bacterium]
MTFPRIRRPGRPLVTACAVVSLAMLASSCAKLQPLTTKEALSRLDIASTKIYAADGSTLIANLHGEIDRNIITLDAIPEHVRNAVISIEDERFWLHRGLDAKSISRALVSNVSSASAEGSSVQGGSTISQQLVKNLYFPEAQRTIQRKMAEARVTMKLEETYSKERILEMYLNTIYFGRGVYGIQTAAESYFRKAASQLTLEEGAFLAGLIHEPGRYDFSNTDPPDRREQRREIAQTRRNVVLDKMVELEHITPEQRDAGAGQPLRIVDRTEDEWKYPYFVDMVLRQLGALRSTKTPVLDERFDVLGSTFQERAQRLYQGGLRVYTTLDPRAQEAAEEAVATVLPDKLEKLSASLVSVEPSSGYVRAVVGGRDYYPDNCEQNPQTYVCKLAKLNIALGEYGGGSGRQPGSSFKPFVLAAALERGVSLKRSYSGRPFSHKYAGQTWKVGNYEGSSGHVNLIDATVDSVNAAYAHLEIDGVGEGDVLKGSARVADVSRRMGIGFPTPDQLRQKCGPDYNKRDACVPPDSVPAIALGAKEVSPLDMASAYATFANDGVHVRPTAVVKITDAKGKVLYQADPEKRKAVAPGVARAVIHVLKEVINRGTGVKAKLGREAAGKTGTSQQWRDAWFAGTVPQLTTVVWVGNALDRPTEEMIPKNGYPFKIVGGSFPAMIWQYYMTKALTGIPAEKFPLPPESVFSFQSSDESEDEEEEETEESEPDGVPSVVGMTQAAAINI